MDMEEHWQCLMPNYYIFVYVYFYHLFKISRLANAFTFTTKRKVEKKGGGDVKQQEDQI